MTTTPKRIVIWEFCNFAREITDGEYIVEYPSMMPLYKVMKALEEKGYSGHITDWNHVV